MFLYKLIKNAKLIVGHFQLQFQKYYAKQLLIRFIKSKFIEERF